MQWRDGLLVILALVLGPPVLALIVRLGLTVVHDGGIAAFSLSGFGSLVSLAYILGWVPMVVVGIINALVSRRFGLSARLLLALPVGAVATGTWMSIVGGNIGAALTPGDIVIIGLGGGFASHVSVMLVELFGPRLPPTI